MNEKCSDFAQNWCQLGQYYAQPYLKFFVAHWQTTKWVLKPCFNVNLRIHQLYEMTPKWTEMITEDPCWSFVAIFVPLDGPEIFEAHTQKIFCLESCFNLQKWSQKVLRCISKSLKTYKSEMEDWYSSKYISVLNGLIFEIFFACWVPTFLTLCD